MLLDISKATDPSGTDTSISMERANLLAALLLPAVAGLALAPFALRWGWDPLRAGLGQVFTPWIFLPGLVLGILAHEALHLLGFALFGGAPRGALHFGVHRATLSPFAGCRVPVRASAYRVAVLLPALVLGMLPLLAGWGLGRGWLAAWGCIMLVAASGDFLVLWAVRAVPNGARVLDHPERVGCRVLGEGEGVRLG